MESRRHQSILLPPNPTHFRAEHKSGRSLFSCSESLRTSSSLRPPFRFPFSCSWLLPQLFTTAPCSHFSSPPTAQPCGFTHTHAYKNISVLLLSHLFHGAYASFPRKRTSLSLPFLLLVTTMSATSPRRRASRGQALSCFQCSLTHRFSASLSFSCERVSAP